MVPGGWWHGCYRIIGVGAERGRGRGEYIRSGVREWGCKVVGLA